MTAPPDQTKRAEDSHPAPPPPARGLRPPRGVKVAAAAIRQPRILMRRLAHRERTAATEGPLRRVWRVLWLAAYHFRKDNGFVFAGHIAYMAMFSIFPFLIFMLALAGAVGEGDAMRQTVELGLTFLPPDVAASLRPAIDEVRNSPHAGLMSVSALVTIWTSSSGIETLRHVLNLAYDVADPPSIIRSRLESMGLTVLAAVVVLASTVLLVIVPLALDVTNLFLRQRFELQNYYDSLRFLLGIGLLLLLLMALYRLLPNVKLRPLEIVPGALLAWSIWVMLHQAYTFYLSHVPSYSITYGSLGGIIITLFFFYISAVLFIFGAEVNSVLKRWRDNRQAGRLRRVGRDDPAR
jgi:membrane protein